MQRVKRSGDQPTLRVAPGLEAALRSGHPWLYRNHLPEHRLKGGEWVRVEAGRAAAYGLYDANGAIGVRLFGPERLTPAALARRVEEALELRAELPSAGNDAYRLLHGEGDFLPGIVCDRYGRYAVMKSYAPSLDALLPDVAKEIGTRLRLKGVVLRSDRDDSGGDEAEDGGRPAHDLTALWGEAPPPELTVSENHLRFVADPWHGQKTGMFLDQRDNRQLVRSLAAGRRVLNLFAYQGGFSVYALAGGARSVVSVDVSRAALGAAEENVRLNGPFEGEHSALAADVFASLPVWAEAEPRYDLVILDPPSLANAVTQRRRAWRAYLKLNRDALRLVAPGGLLVTSSCTAQVGPEAFKEVVAEAALAAGVRAQVVAENGHAIDHPVPLSFPEGRYLKFLALRVLA
ncbi:MAG: class I SAM-dependent rRNA methyltransferase [Trueperaceae bacterium]